MTPVATSTITPSEAFSETPTATATETETLVSDTVTPTPTETPIEQGGLPAANGFTIKYILPAPALQLDTPTLTPTLTSTPTPTRTATTTIVPTNTAQPSSTPSKTFSPTPMTLTATKTKTLTQTKTPAPTGTTVPSPYLSMMGYWNLNFNDGVWVADDSQKEHVSRMYGSAAIIDDASPYLYLNGTQGWLQVTRDSDLDHTHGFTLSVRVKYEKTFVTGAATPTSGIPGAGLIWVDSNTLLLLRSGYLELYTLGLNPPTLRGPLLTLNVWNTVTVVYDSVEGSVRIYLNGVEAASQLVSGTITPNGPIMTFGDSTVSSPMRYKGGMDEVRFYNRPLSASEIAAMNAGPTPTTNPNRSTSTLAASATRTLTPSKTPTFPTPTKTATSATPSKTVTQTASNTPKATAVDLSNVYGNSADGALYIATGATFNINADGKNKTDGCPDGGDAVSYRVVALTAASATLNMPIGAGCLSPGDEVLLISLVGTASKHTNVGSYEFLRVGSVDSVNQLVTFSSVKSKNYGEDAGLDNNIGLTAGQQVVALVRVPNYSNVTILGSGRLTASVFEPATSSSTKGIGGLIVFRAAGILQGEGIIDARSLGYHGGPILPCGESSAGYTASAGGGCSGGGSYGAAGAAGTGTAGATYGSPDLQDKLYFGAGGGGYMGTRGGGIIYITAKTVQQKTGDTYHTSLLAQGQAGTGGGGGSGAGGSIYLRSRSIVTGPILVDGGLANGGTAAGGSGRSAVYYETSFAAYNTPIYLEDTSPSTPTVTRTRTPGPSWTPSRTPTVNGQPSIIRYDYNSHRPHAVTRLSNGSAYTYDANGNMKTRNVDGVTTTFVYDGNNRVTSANNPSTSEIYWYDGDGTRVAKLADGVLTAYFAGGSYEVTANASGTVTSTKRYYALGGASILDDNGTLRYLLTDHAGSNVAITNSNGNLLSHQRYMPFGQIRPDVAGISQTDFGYTSQRNMSSLGLMDYNARFYDPELGRFTQPDTIVSNPADPQTWNRYSYVSNNPINFTDPTGHCQLNGHWMDDNSSACGGNGGSSTPSPSPSIDGGGQCNSSNSYCQKAKKKDKESLVILVCGYGAKPDCDNEDDYDPYPLAPYYSLTSHPTVFGFTNNTKEEKIDISNQIYNLVANNPGKYNIVGHSAGGTATILAVARLIKDGFADRINNLVLLDPAMETLNGVNTQDAADTFSDSGIRVFLGDVVKGDGDDHINLAEEFQTDKIPGLKGMTHLQLATSLVIYNKIVTSPLWRP